MRAYVLALNMILATATASVAAQNEPRQTTQGHTTTITGVIIQQGPDYMIAEPNEMTPIAVLQGVDFQTGHFANYMGQMVRVRGILDTTGERKLLRVKSIGDIEKTGAPKQ
jgi:hypothetical protein